MIRRRQGAALVALAFAAFSAGCKSNRSAPQASSAPSAAASTLPAAPVQSAPAAAEIPTEEDFEDEATETISSKNVDDELDKLEREIGAP